ncbi:hypothetical protein [Stenotrophomonas sp.]|uniref:hypothetical protein n=1 Tax=Stenotrophomonas sp. TaxID=69392 RepID=UPI0028B1B880|nr:hypothetical protein [Stenotrophomonas sp.]
MQTARFSREKAMEAEDARKGRGGFAPAAIAAGIPEAQAGLLSSAFAAGYDPTKLSGYIGATQEQGFRGDAVARALAGDFGAANANLMGVANGPVELASVQGQNLINNRLLEGGGGITTTDQGRAGIAADAARAAASYASANSSNASAARTRQASGIDAAQFNLQRNGMWAPGGRSAGGGGSDAGAPKLTEGQSKDLVYLKRGDEANKLLETMAGNLTASGGQQGARGAADVFLRGLPGVGDSAAVNSLVSAPRQQAEQAAREFLAAVLRKDTGAAITSQEFDIYGQTYLPQPGDSAAVLRQKAKSRQVALDAIATGLGPERAAIARPAAGSPAQAFGGAAPMQVGGGVRPTTGQAPAIGTTRNGYRYTGGNPADRASWEKL